MDLSRATGLGGGDYTPAPEGNHRAVCVAVIDLGTQTRDSAFGTKSAREIMIRWELCDELMDDGRPYTIGKRYSYSMHERANLRKHLESWRGVAFTEADFQPGGFKIENLLGKGCLVSVKHDDKGDRVYANVDTVTRLPKGMTPGQPTIVPYLFDLEAFDADAWTAISDGIKRIICSSPEAQKLGLGAPAPQNGRAIVQQRLAAAAPTAAYHQAQHDMAYANRRGAMIETRFDTELDDEIPF
jgi:hypothetical protein